MMGMKKAKYTRREGRREVHNYSERIGRQYIIGIVLNIVAFR